MTDEMEKPCDTCGEAFVAHREATTTCPECLLIILINSLPEDEED